MAETAFAPAKVNLTLHVTGQRADGYHLLDSLVVFADVGDRLFINEDAAPGLSVTGPMAAGVPTDASNLVLRAVALLGASDVAITLEKHLPAAAGIGGGSSDAAATLRLLSEAVDAPLPPDNGLSLGADVPVCLYARACRMGGIGEAISPVPDLPPVPMVLINPRVSVPTGPVFQGLASKTNPAMPKPLPRWPDVPALAAWLAMQRNDLEPPARALEPAIDTCLGALQATDKCLLARMSGSGATCFGVYPDEPAAKAAARALQPRFPDFWVVPTICC